MQTEPNNEEKVTEQNEVADIQEETNLVEENEALNEESKLAGELKEAKEKYLRLYADFENFRRRTAKEKLDLIQNASESVILDVLPIIDDFERANQSFENATDIQALKEGVDLIFAKLIKMVASKGVKEIEAKDADFDVEFHECITQFAAGEDKKGKVIDVVEKGYTLNEKVIRYAKVVVGS